MKTYTKCIKLQTLQNNISFSLYVILSVYYRITTLEGNQSLRRISTDKKVYYYKTLELIF